MRLTPAEKIRLGTFLIAGAVLFGVAVVVLTGLRLIERREHYTVRFSESVAGLEPSAPVKYRGLRVGRIDQMRVAPDAPDWVEVTLALDPDTPLYEGVTATLDTSGLTGLKAVNLMGGDPRLPRLVEGARIPTGPSLVNRITGQAEQIAVKMELIANQIAQWTGSDNRRRVESLVEGVDGLARESTIFLAETRRPLADALQGVKQASEAVAGLVGETESVLGFFRGEVASTLRDIRKPLEKTDPEQVAAMLGSIQSAMRRLDDRLSEAEAGELLRRLDTTVQQMGRVIETLELAVRAGRQDFVSSLSYLRQAAEDVREFSRLIAQDPSVLVRGKELKQ